MRAPKTTFVFLTVLLISSLGLGAAQKSIKVPSTIRTCAESVGDVSGGNSSEKAAQLATKYGAEKIPGSTLTKFDDTLRLVKMDPSSSRESSVGKIVAKILGQGPIASVRTLQPGGGTEAEVYLVTLKNNKRYVLKIFKEDENKALRRAIRDAGASKTLNSTQGLSLKAPEVVEIVRIQDEAQSFPAVLMTAAEGSPLNEIIFSAGQDATSWEIAKTASAHVGAALGDFHARSTIQYKSAAQVKEALDYRDKEHFSKLRRWFETDDVAPESFISKFVRLGWLKKNQGDGLKDAVQKLISKYQKLPIERGSIVHGDAKTDNFIYDSSSQTVTSIDNETMGRTLHQVGDPMEDLGRLIQGIEKEGVKGGLTDLQIDILKSQCLSAYLAVTGVKQTDLMLPLKFYQVRSLGATVGTPVVRMTDAQAARLLDNMVKKLGVDLKPAERLDALLEEPYFESPDENLPPTVNLLVGKEHVEKFFNMVVKIGDDEVDTDALERAVNKVLKDPQEIGKSSFNRLKFIRKRLILIRNFFIVFDVRHKAPPGLSKVTTTLGLLNDYLENENFKMAEETAKGLSEILEKVSVKDDILKFKADSKKHTLNRLTKSVSDIKNLLALGKVSETKFHKIRKSMRRYMTMLRLMEAEEPFPTNRVFINSLHSINLVTAKMRNSVLSPQLQNTGSDDDENGNDNDEGVTGNLESPDFVISNDFRQKLENVLDRFHFEE